MLLAHYRAIFKHAYVKGLATAVVVGTLGLTGTAQAATLAEAVAATQNDETTITVSDETTAADVTVGGDSNTKHKNTAGDADVNTDVLDINEKVATAAGSTLTADAAGTSDTNAGTININAEVGYAAATTGAGATINVNSAGSLTLTGALTNAGTVSLDSAVLTVGGKLDNNAGKIDNVSGDSVINFVAGTGASAADLGTVYNSAAAETTLTLNNTDEENRADLGTLTVTQTDNKNTLELDGDWSVSTDATVAKGNLAIAEGGDLEAADGGVTVAEGNFTNEGTVLLNGQDLTVTAGVLDNTNGTINTSGDVTITFGSADSVLGTIVNTEAAEAGKTVTLDNDGTEAATLVGITQNAGNTVAYDGKWTDNGSAVTIAQGNAKVMATTGEVTLTEGLEVTSGDFTNAGTVSLDSAVLTVGGKLDNNAGKIDNVSGDSVINFVAGSGATLANVGNLNVASAASVTLNNTDSANALSLSNVGTVTNNEGAVVLSGLVTVNSSDLTKLAELAGTSGAFSFASATVTTDVASKSEMADLLNTAIAAGDSALAKSYNTASSLDVDWNEGSSVYYGSDQTINSAVAGAGVTSTVVDWLPNLTYTANGYASTLTSFYDTNTDGVYFEEIKQGLSNKVAASSGVITAQNGAVLTFADGTVLGDSATVNSVTGEITEISGELDLVAGSDGEIVFAGTVSNLDDLSATSGGQVTINSGVTVYADTATFTAGTLYGAGPDAALNAVITADAAYLSGDVTLVGDAGSSITGINTNSADVTLDKIFSLAGDTYTGDDLTLGAASYDVGLSNSAGVVITGNGYTLAAESITIGSNLANTGLVVDGDLTLGQATTTTVSGTYLNFGGSGATITSENKGNLTLNSDSSATAITDVNYIRDLGNLTLNAGAYSVSGDSAIVIQGNLSLNKDASLILESSADVIAAGNITLTGGLSSNDDSTSDTDTPLVMAGGTLSVGKQVLTGDVSFSNGTGNTDLTKLDSTGTVVLTTTGDGTYSAATIGNSAADSADYALTGGVGVVGTTLTASAVDFASDAASAAAVVVKGLPATAAAGVLDLSSVSKANLTMTQNSAVVLNGEDGLNSVVKFNAASVLTMATSGTALTAANTWDSNVSAAAISIVDNGKINLTGLSNYTLSAANAQTIADAMGFSGDVIFADVGTWTGTGTSGAVSLDDIATVGGSAPTAKVVDETKTTGETLTINSTAEFATLTTGADDVAVANGRTLTLDGDGTTTGSFITGDKTVDVGAGGTLAVNNSGILGAVEGNDTAGGTTVAADLNAHAADGVGEINLNVGSDGVPLSDIDDTAVVTIAQVGFASADATTGVVTYNRVNEVEVGKGSAVVTGGMYATDVTLRNEAVLTTGSADVTGDIVTETTNGQGTLNAGTSLTLVNTDAQDQTISGTEVNADSTIVLGTNRRINVFDNDGVASVLDTGTLALNGNSLLVDPSIVYIDTLSTDTSTAGSGDAATSTLLGDIILGEDSGVYVGATQTNLDTYIALNDSDEVEIVATNKVAGQTLNAANNHLPAAVAMLDTDVVIGVNTPVYAADGTTITGYINDNDSSINVDPTITQDKLALTQYVINGDTTGIVDGNPLDSSVETNKNQVRVVNGGLLVLNGNLSFADTELVDNIQTVITLSPDVAYEILPYDSDLDGENDTNLLNRVDGTAGALLLKGSATATADLIELTGGTVYVDSSTNATLTGVGTLNANGEPTAAGIAADDTQFVIAKGSSLTLDNDGGSTHRAALSSLATDTTFANGENVILGTLNLDGYFTTTDDTLDNLQDDGADQGTLNVLSGSNYLISAANNAAGVDDFLNINNYGTLTLAGSVNGFTFVRGTNITNTGTLNLQGYTIMGDAGGVDGTASFTNTGTITVTGNGTANTITTDTGYASTVGTFTQSSDGVINVGTVDDNGDQDASGNLTLTAEKFNFQGKVNTTVDSNFTIRNHSAEEAADLTGVTFANDGTVTLRDLGGDLMAGNGFKLTASQLDSTATSKSSGSLIWSGTNGDGDLVLAGATIKTDSANLSEASGNLNLTATAQSYIRVTGTTTLDDDYDLGNIYLYTSRLDADELDVTDGRVYVVDTLNAHKVIADDAGNVSVVLGLAGEDFTANKTGIYAVNTGTVVINGSSTTIGDLFAGDPDAAVVTAGTININGDITTSSVTLADADSLVNVDGHEVTITGELTTVAPTTVGTNGLIIDEGVVTAENGLNLAAGSVTLQSGSDFNIAWSDVAGGTITDTTSATAFAEYVTGLSTDFAQGAVKVTDVDDFVNISGYSGSMTAQQYANMKELVLTTGDDTTAGAVRMSGVTYDPTGVTGYDETDNAISQEDVLGSVAHHGEFFKGVNVTDIDTAIAGTQVWGTATLAEGETALNVGTAAAGYLELSGAKTIKGETDADTTYLYVATADNEAANVVLGSATTSGLLVLNGSGTLGTVTFNDDDSNISINGTSETPAVALFNKVIDGSTVNDGAGSIELEYAKLSVTLGDVALNELVAENSTLTALGGDITSDGGRVVSSSLTAAKGVDLDDVEKVTGATIEAQDGTVEVQVRTNINKRVITDSQFTASTKVTVEGGRTVTGNTLTAGTAATLNAGPTNGVEVVADNAYTVSNNKVLAGSAYTATLDASNVRALENEVGEYVASTVSGNTVQAVKAEDGTREGSKAVFTVGNGRYDAESKTVLKRNVISSNVVDAEKVEYSTGNYNEVTGDKVTADKQFEVVLGDKTTVKNSTFTAGGVAGTDDASTLSGELTSNDKVEVLTGALKLTGTTKVLDESTVQSRWLNVNDNTLFIDPAYVFAEQVTTSATEANDKLDGDVIVGDGSAFYVGADDTANNDIANVSALKSYLAASAYDSVAYIEDDITLVNDSVLVVDDDLTSSNYETKLADTTYAGYGDAVYVGAGDALVVTNDALGEQDENGNYTNAAITLGTAGSVDIDGTLALEGVNVFNGETLQVFSNTTTADAANIKVGNNLFSGTLSDAGVVTAAYSSDKADTYLSATDDSIADAIKEFAAQTDGLNNQFVASSFVNKALNFNTPAEAGKALNSAVRFAVLGGAVQNAQVAQRAYTDAIEERMGFVAKTSSNIGEVKGTDITVWVTPQYSYSDSEGYSAGKSGGYGMDSKLWGIALGADVAFQNGLTAGMAFHGGSGKSDKNGGGFAKTHSDFTYFGLSLYGAYQYQGFKVLGDFTFTNTRNDIDQDNPVGKIKDKFDTNLYSIGLTGKYDFTFDGGVTVTPHLGVRWSHFKVDSFTASVDGADSIKGKSFNGDQVTFPVGVGVSKDFRTKNGWALKPAADFSIIPVAGDRDVKSKIVSNNIEMSAKSDISDAVLFRGRVGFDAQYKNFGLGIGYTYLGSKNTSSHSFSVTARYTF